MKEQYDIHLKNLNECAKLAKKISKFIQHESFLCLYGDLGSGKTTFARFLINSLADKKTKVLSPTFPILQTYDLSKIKIWHYDLYRISKKDEIFNLDFETALKDCVIVEWPEIVKDFLPKNRIDFFFFEDKHFNRRVKIKFFGKIYKKELNEKIF